MFFEAFISLSHVLQQFVQWYVFDVPGLFMLPQKLHVWDVYASFTRKTCLLNKDALYNKRSLNL